MDKKTERRRTERFDLNLSSAVAANEEDGGQSFIGLLTSNICAGGAFFKTDRPLPVGTAVNIDFTLPLDEFSIEGQSIRIRISGEVIRNEEEGMAVSFDKEYKILPSS